MSPARNQSQPILPQHVQSSNTTASLFLGRTRRSWMATGSNDEYKNGLPHHLSSSSQTRTRHSQQAMQSRPPPPLDSPRAQSGSGPILTPDSSAPTSQKFAPPVNSTATAENVLMSPVSPEETLQNAFTSIRTTSAATAATATSNAAPPPLPSSRPTAAVLPTSANVPAYQATSLPSPDPSNASAPSPASAIARNSDENPLSTTTSFSPRTPQIPVPSRIQSGAPNPPSSVRSPFTSADCDANNDANNFVDLSGRDGNNGDSVSQQLTAADGAQSSGYQNGSPASTPIMAHAQSNVQNNTADTAHSTSMSNANSVDDQFWTRARENVIEMLAYKERRGSHSLGIELPRLRVLKDACEARDLSYTLLHQAYCLRDLSPVTFSKCLAFSEEQERGLDVVQRLLVENKRVSAPFLQWCVNFPCQLSVALRSQRYQAMLPQIKRSLVLMSERWNDFEQAIARRSYPPLIDELVANFGMTSSVLCSVVFTAISRHMYSSRFNAELQALFLQNQKNYSRRFSNPRYPIQQMQKENQDLVRAYQSLYNQSAALSAVQTQQQFTTASLPSPRPPPSQAAWPSVNSPAYRPPTNSPITQQNSFAQFTTGANTPYTDEHTQRAQFELWRRQQNNSPALPRGHQAPGNSHGYVSTAWQQPLPSSLPPTTPGFAPAHPRPFNLPPHFHYPSGDPRQAIPTQGSGYASPYQVPVSSLMHGVQPGRLNAAPMLRMNPLNTQPQSPVIQTPVVGMRTGSSPHVRAHHPEPPTSHNRPPQPVSAQFNVPENVPLLPRPDSIPTHLSRAHPLQVALHQAHLRNPIRKCARVGPAGIEETELFQYLSSFAAPPTPLGQEECVFRWKFSLSRADCERFPRNMEHGMGHRSTKFFYDGSQTYRFRCVRETPSTDLSEPAWALTKAVWPNVIYVFVNGVELYVRRKIHNGKDFPLDITDHLHEGENVVTLHFLRNPAECKDVLYAAAVEVLSVSSLESTKKLTRSLPAAESRKQIQARLSSSNEDDDVAVTSKDITVELVDPFMARIFNVPARSRLCSHIECFDLETFITTKALRSGRSHMKENWKCPICGGDSRPHTLVIDGFLTEVRNELERTNRLEETKAIVVKADGTWRVKTGEEARARSPSLDTSASDEPLIDAMAKRKSNNLASPPVSTKKRKTPKLETQASDSRVSEAIPQQPRPPVIELD